MNLLRPRALSIAALLILLALSVASVAQTSNGTIVGVISDPHGAVVQNADIAATNTATGEQHNTTTNAFGSYRIGPMPAGSYTIIVKSKGFAELKLSNVLVPASVTITANGSLQLGDAETVVEVDTTGLQLHTDDGQISHNISNVEITQIPIANGSPISLVLTEPGVVAPSGRENFTNGVGFSVDGTRPRANNFLIEGQDNNDAAIQGQALQVTNLEAVKELSILTNSYGAEFGHGGGSVTNLIYKNGTNDWHGGIFDQIQNSSFDSATAQDKRIGAPKAISRENTYGFTIGGPIKKNKIFVFGAIQWDKTRQNANGSTLIVPTAAGVAALQSLLPNPRIANYLTAIGNLRGDPNSQDARIILLTGGRPGVGIGDAQRQVGEPINDTQYVAKGDWSPTSNDSVTLRYIYDVNNLSPDFGNFSGQLPGFDTQQGGSSHNAGINYTHVFSPHVINEFRASYGRIGFSFFQTPQTLANPLANGPSVNITGLTGFGAPGGIPQGRFHNTFQYEDTVSWNRGNHSFKFGADLSRILVRDQIPFNSFGSLAYANSTGNTALNNFIDDFSGRNGSATRAFGSPITRPRFFFQNYFVEDAWKVRSNLTLTLGLRYENSGTPGNSVPFPAVSSTVGANDPIFPNAIQQQPDSNNFAPRLGIAYTPHFWEKIFGHDKTVIRAGYGMFYDSFFTNIVDNTAASSPNVVTPLILGGATGRGVANISTQFAALNPVLNPLNAVTTMVSNLVQPITHQWNLNIERELPGKFTLTTAYVGTRGIRLFANDQFNPIDPNTGLRVIPTRGSWTVRDNSGDSIYHALDVKLERRYSHGIFVRTSYTYSKLLDTASEVFTTTGLSSFPADLTLGHRGIDRGLSAFDRRQRLVVAYIYDIPKFKGDSNFGYKALGYVINGWQMGGSTAYQAGAPATVADGIDANGDGQNNDRPNLANPGAPILNWAIDGSQLGGAAGVLCDGPAAIATGKCSTVLNGTGVNGVAPVTVSASNVHWIVPAFGALGNTGRNTVISPGRQDWTFDVQRVIKLHSERHQFIFRAELINPFNHPNTGNAPFSLAGIKQVVAFTPQVPNPPTQTFGSFASTVAGNRNIRFWLKYQF